MSNVTSSQNTARAAAIEAVAEHAVHIAAAGADVGAAAVDEAHAPPARLDWPLPRTRRARAEGGVASAHLAFDIDAAQAQALLAALATDAVQPCDLALGAWALTLRRLTGSAALRIGFADGAGPEAGLAFALDDEATVADVLRATARIRASAAASPPAGPSAEQVRLLWGVGEVMDDRAAPRTPPQAELTLQVALGGARVDARLEGDAALFDRDAVDRFLRCWRTLFDAAIVDAARAVGDLPMLDAAMRETMLHAWNATEVGYPLERCAHRLFEAVAADAPDAIALVSGERRMRYGELNARANRLAGWLRAQGIGPGDRVALMLDRGFGMVEAILATIKAGAAYVPIATDAPEERLRFMLGDAAPALLLGDGPRPAADAVGARLTRIDTLGDALADFPPDDADAPISSSLPAYIIYTSGTSGHPKGVLVSHRNLVNFCFWCRDAGFTGAGVRMTQFAPYTFDASAGEIFAALLVGAELHLLDGATIQDPARLQAYMRAQRIGFSALPPAYLQQMDPALAPEGFHLLTAGSAPTPELARAWASRGLYLNGYGPTETTILSTAADLGADLSQDHERITIGRAISNTRLYLLDARMQPVPVGVAGEIWIGGEGVAIGYLNQPALTAERFRDDPFADAPGARMYRTGDLGRWLPDGSVEFMGRNDFQVKIRGFRIELGEIEAALRACAGIREALVLAREDDPGEPRLVAYCLVDAAHDDGRLEIEALRRRLAQSLPEYMVPAAFVRIEAWPLTANGKIDRRALPAPDAEAYAGRPYRAPVGATETALAAIWAEALGIERVGRDDNFFALGGHSLLAMQVIQSMRRQGLAAEVADLFAAEDLAALAQAVGRGEAETAVPANAIPADAARIEPWMLGLVSLDQAQIDAIVARTPGGAANIADIYPLSPLQEGMLYHHTLSAEGDLYLLSSLLGFADRARMERFLAALQAVIDRHDVLRTAIEWEGLPLPMQIVRREVRLSVEPADIAADVDDVAAALKARYSPNRCRVDLRQPPLLRLYAAEDRANGRWLLRMLGHHIAMDHHGFELMLAEVRAIERGEADALPPPVPYRGFVARSRAQADDPAHRAFFARMLGDIDEPTAPFGVLEAGDPGVAPAVVERDLPQALTAALRAHCRRLGIAASSVMHLAWAMVLARTVGRDATVFGTIVFGRMHSGDDAHRALGLFINTLPCRIDVDERPLERALKETHALLARMMGHEHAPLAQTQRCSALSPGTPLFSTLLNYRYGERAGPYGEDSGVTLLDDFEQTNYPITVSVDDFGADLRLVANVREGIDADAVCAGMERALLGVLDALECGGTTPIAAIDVMAAAERETLLRTWNATARDYPAHLCVHERFALVAAQAPQAPAVVEGAEVWTYAELGARADRIAQRLVAAGVRAEDRVAIAMPRCAAMVAGVLGILKAGGVYVPIDPGYPRERIDFLLDDSAPAAILADAASLQADWALRIGVPRVSIAAAMADPPCAAPTVEGLGARSGAYMIYTSGSTGRPKGVLVEHRNILRLTVNNTFAPLQADDAVAHLANPAFDASTWELWAPLLNGARVVVIGADSALDPQTLRQALIDGGVTALWMTVGLFNEYVDALAPAFARLRHLLVGGDALDPRKIARLLERAERPGRVVNGYGPTETTTFAVTHLIEEVGAGARSIPIGKPIANTRVYVLDARMRPAPIGTAGELYIGGDGVARGYWNRPELSAERFVDDPFGEVADARLYRTGDVVRWRADGVIEFLGRADFQVKIRGYRVELGEIEAALAACDGVREAVVVVLGDSAADKQLVAYYLAEPSADGAAPDGAALRDALAGTLPDYMLPSAFVRMEAWPLTANGKLDRRALPAPGAADRASRAYAAPEGPIEQRIAALWSELLGVERIGRCDNFFELGGHSLIAMQLMSRVRAAFGIELPMRALFDAPTVAGFAECIAAGAGEATQVGVEPALEARDRDTPPPLSLAQQRLWLLSRIDDAGAAYHMPCAYRLRGALDADALARALRALVARHEALRTRFDVVDGEARQRIADADAFEMLFRDLRGEADIERSRLALAEACFREPFDLARDLPIRAQLLRLGDASYEFQIVVHHIAADGWSVAIALQELNALYASERGRAEGAALAPLALQYADFAWWQRERLARGAFEGQTAYWKRALAGAPILLELPTDRQRPALQSFAGDNVEVRLDPALLADLKALAQRHDVTLYMVLLAGWAALLARLSNQSDIVIGSPVAGRNRGEIEPLIGFFVNTLPMRLDLDGAPTVGALLARARRCVLDAQAHQDLPFDQIVEAANPARSVAHSPIFQVMLALQSLDLPALALDGVESEEIPGGAQDAKYDLSLELAERAGVLHGHLNYARDLFDRDSAQRHVAYLLRLLRGMADADDRAVAALPILDAAERGRLLHDWNATEAPYPQVTAHALFEAQAARTPEARALVFGAETLTYAELDRRADRLARRLRALGVRANDRVAICVARGVGMVVAVLGVLKSGAAYVPLDTGFPRERLVHIVEDSRPALALCDDEGRALLARGDEPAILALRKVELGADGAISGDDPSAGETDADAAGAESLPALDAHLAYIIFTSGSTGRPKGVCVPHRAVVNFLTSMAQAPGLRADDVLCAVTTLSFDISVLELLLPLSVGACVALADRETAIDGEALAALLARVGATAMQATPATWRMLLDSGWTPAAGMRLMCGGEAWQMDLGERLLAGGAELWNMYGPTETTVWSMIERVVPGQARVTIGGPIANTRVYVLDAQREPLPCGVVGELYIGGDGVTLGYYGRDDLTAERFVPDPHAGTPDARMYKTGDLVRRAANGTIQFLGRNDFQVKIRGFRIELGEIEAALNACPGLREAAVLAREDRPGDQRLVGYFLADAAVDPAALREALSRTLPDYMVPSAFVRMAAMPLTPNGKLDRKSLPAPDGDAYAVRAYEAPQSAEESAVAALWAELLQVERVGRQDNFFELGGHSLIAVKMVERLRRQGLHSDARALFNAPTLAVFAESLRGESGSRGQAPAARIPAGADRIAPEMLPLVSLDQAEIDAIVAKIDGGAANVQDVYPLSPLQEGILYHRLLEARGDAYQASAILGFPDRDSVETFVATLQRVVDRHDILRTAFVWEGLGEPVQVVQRRARLVHEAATIDPAAGPVRDQLAAHYDPARFRVDLSRAPLFRCCHAQDPESGRWLMCVVFHHLVMDHTSLEQVIAEAAAIGAGREAELPAAAPYRNYIWQVRHSVDHAAHRAHFGAMLGDIDQPTAAFGLTAMNEEGARVDESGRRLPDALSAALRQRARELGVGVAAIVHLAWGLVLARATGQERVVFGTVLFGRMEGGEDADRALGLFINTLPLRVDVGDVGIADAIRATHAALAGLLRHEHASLAEAQRCSALPASTPLFTSLLNYRNVAERDPLADALRIESVAGGERTHYPLAVVIGDLGDAFEIGVQTRASVGAARICDFIQTALAGVLDALAAGASTPVSTIDVLPPEERREIVHGWNLTARDYPLSQSVHALFAAQAARTPDAVALVFGEERIAYAALDARANRMAHALRTRGVAPGALVAVSLDRGIGMIAALLAVLKAGAAYVPMAVDAPVDRVAFMLADAAPALLLAQASSPLPQDPGVAVLTLESLDAELDAHPDAAPAIADLSSAMPAYVIYTSGTTGTPKGVLVAHRNVVNFCCWCREAGLLGPGERMTQFAPYTFDASAGEIFAGLLNGVELHLLDDATIQSPQRLQQYLVDRRIDFSALPPAYLQQMDPALAPPGFRLLTAGSAPTPELVRTWAGRGAYLNGYGPTETTILSTAGALSADEETISIGRPIANTRVYLLDERRRPVPIGVPGEIWIGGDGVTPGYLNRDALTAEVYRDDPFAGAPGARMYRTGDLGRWLRDGTVEFLGRNDFQVKIRGFRIELGEIESRLCAFPDVREAVVLARDAGAGDKRLVAYCLCDQLIDEDALRQHLAQTLPEYMVPAAVVRMSAWPLTANGKIDRRALPAPADDAYARRPYEAPQTETERALAEVWGELLGIERVGRDDGFFELGGHSLLAMQLVSRIRRAFGAELSLRGLFETPTLAALAQRIDAIGGDDALRTDAIPRRDRDGPAPLSVAQQRLWFLAGIEGAGAAYHMGGRLCMTGALDADALASALRRLVARHDSLRTRFAIIDGEPVQVIDADARIALETLDLRADGDGADAEDRAAELYARMLETPFDLGVGPLLRVRLLRTAEDRHELQVTMHHIVSDGWSLGVLMRELCALYAAALTHDDDPLPPLPIAYADFAAWQRDWLDRDRAEALAGYWRRTLEGAPTLLDLPTDRPRPQVQDFAGGSLELHLDAELTARLRGLAQRCGATLYMLCLAAWAATLARLANQDEIVIGSPVAGRNRSELEPLIGFFVNTLALRIDLGDDPTVSALIERTRRQVLDAQAHQDLPFDRVVEAVRPQRSTAHTPIFQTMLTLNDQRMDALRMPGLAIETVATEARVAQFDLMLDLGEREADVLGIVNYASALFDRDTAARWAECWMRLLRAMVDDPSQPVSALPLLDDAGRERVIEAWNRTDAAYPHLQCLHEAVAARAAERPQSPALICADDTIAYAELNARANRLAHRLIAAGVGPDDRVALCMARGADAIVALLAVLKAGGAYVAVDPNLPSERIADILADCAPKAVLAPADADIAAPAASLRIAAGDEDAAARWPDTDPDIAASGLEPRHLAYVIYTSGSTGRPKGVLIEHRSAMARIAHALADYGLGPDDRCLQFSSLSFDASVMQIFSTLHAGAALVMRGESLWSPEETVAEIARHRVSVADVPPTYLPALFDAEAQRAMTDLRVVIVGGEATAADVLRGRAFAQTILNEYGPTEATITATRLRVRAGDALDSVGGALSIGSPIANTRVYILDRRLRPVPVGSVGEIHIGGVGVARGYLNLPELTAERFIEDPFSPQSEARMYRTGDLGRWRVDGTIEYVGRNDHQVKIRGFRIELGEIETRLRALDGVRDATVVARTDGAQTPRLVAYVLAGEAIDVAALREALARQLPDYMVPAAFVRMEAWPIDRSGKLDRRALPAPDDGAYARDAYAPPQGAVERAIAATWERLLGVERIGRDDRFFELGGHSLLLMRMLGSLSEQGIEIAIQDVYAQGSVRRLAAAADARVADPAVWLSQRGWAHAVVDAADGRTLYLAPADAQHIAAFRRALQHAAADARPIRIALVDDPAAAAQAHRPRAGHAHDEHAHDKHAQAVPGDALAQLAATLARGRAAAAAASTEDAFEFAAIHDEFLGMPHRDGLHVLPLAGWWSADDLRGAFAGLVRAQPMLRAVAEIAPRRWRVLAADAFRADDIPWVDLRALSRPRADAAIAGIADALRAAKADAVIGYAAALVSRGDCEHALVLYGDHLLWDGQSFEAMIEAMRALLDGQPVAVGARYRDFCERARALPDPAQSQALAATLDSAAVAVACAATDAAIERIAARPGARTRASIATLPLRPDEDPAETAFALFRRTVAEITGLDRVCVVLPQHGRRLGDRDYFGEVGLFLDKVPVAVDATLRLEQAMTAVSLLQRHGVRYLDWVRSGDPAVAGTLPPPLNEVGFNYQLTDAADLDPATIDHSTIRARFGALRGISCEVYAGDAVMHLLLSYTATDQEANGVNKIIESASGTVLDLAERAEPARAAAETGPHPPARHDAVPLAAGDPPAIVVENVRKRYGDTDVVKGISFSVPKGACFGILGPNGAGKTTLLGMIEGIVPITAGRISVMGLDVATRIRQIQPMVGVQLQYSNYFQFLSVLDLVNFYAELRAAASGKPRSAIKSPVALLERLDLGDKLKFKVDELSGGQKQRLSIVLALIDDPQIVFLDEPTAALDPHSRRYTWEFVEELKKDRNRTIVLTTHYMEEAERLCDEIMIVNRGEIVGQGHPAALIADLKATQQTRIRLDSGEAGEAIARALTPAWQATWDAFNDTLVIATDDVAGALPQAIAAAQAHRANVLDIHIERLSLEDVFLDKTGKELKQ